MQTRGLLNSGGVDRLLDVADRLAGDDPRKAQRLAEVCADLAEEAEAPAAVPRSAYIRVHTHNEKGEFDTALRMVKLAHDAYLALGMDLEALRTRVGLMVTLLELGHYQEAVEAGNTVLQTIDQSNHTTRALKAQGSELLSALVYQNLGRCYEYIGSYDNALESYDFAESHYQALGMTERVGEILDNRGAIFSALGEGIAALESHESAADIFYKAKLTLAYTKSLVNVGEASLRLGTLRKA